VPAVKKTAPKTILTLAPSAPVAKATARARQHDLGPPSDPVERAALERAHALLKARDVPGALAVLEPFEMASSHPGSLLLLGRLRMARGNFDAAVALYRRAERLYPALPAVWEALAELHAIRREFADELVCRRNLIYVVAKPSARAYLDWIRCAANLLGQGGSVSLSEFELASARIVDAPGLTPEVRLQFAYNLFQNKKMVDAARNHYRAVSPRKPSERDIEATWTPVRTWAEQQQLPSKFGDPGGTGRELVVVELRDALPLAGFQWVPLVGGERVALEGFVMRRVRTRSELAESPVLLHNRRFLDVRLPMDVDRIERPAVLLGGIPQYYHHTLEHLSRLAVLEALGFDEKLPLVVNHDLAPFQEQQLALLGYGSDRLIRLAPDRPTVFARLVVPTPPVKGGIWMHPLVAAWARERLVPLARSSSVTAKTGRYLYLSRRGAPRRRVGNEDELVATLAARDFEVIQPELLSVTEQITLFAQAQMIVAPAGAALTNMLFMPVGGTVVVLQSDYAERGAGDQYFDALAAACGHRFRAISGPAVDFRDGRTLMDADFNIDPGVVVAALTE